MTSEAVQMMSETGSAIEYALKALREATVEIEKLRAENRKMRSELDRVPAAFIASLGRVQSVADRELFDEGATDAARELAKQVVDSADSESSAVHVYWSVDDTRGLPSPRN